jgi:DNA-binding MarR family transcriptional regulator
MANVPMKVDNRCLPMLDHLARVGRRAAELSMSPGGLRPRHLIALGLLRDQGPLSQQGLGEVLSLDPSNVVGLLNELEQRELITRRRDPSDRRRHNVELSTKGEEALAVAYARLGLVEDHLLSTLSAAERATLHQLLVRVVGAESRPCCAGGAEEPSSRACESLGVQ